MLEALPVVIPTLNDVARGTLRPVEIDDAGATDAHTAAILLDARTSSAPALGSLYGELELYLQAANISTLRLHRRGRSTVSQMLDIIAGVTLLHSRGCQQVILIVAADGALPRWERSRAETLASLLKLIRRHHSGTARELIGAIEDLVKNIRVVADSVAGVATILMGAPELATGSRAAASHSTFQPPSAASVPHSPKALALSLADGDDHVSVISQLYLWCCALTDQRAVPKHQATQVSDVTAGPVSLDHSDVMYQLRAVGASFHRALDLLDAQWDRLISEAMHAAPESAESILAEIDLALHAAQQSRSTAQSLRMRINSRAWWTFLDSSTRLKWLESCNQVFRSLREGTSEIETTGRTCGAQAALVQSGRTRAPA
jgi:hypothetical protein